MQNHLYERSIPNHSPIASTEIKYNSVLRIGNLCEYIGLSKTTIYEKLKPKSPGFDPTFPKAIKLSSCQRGAVGWRLADINAWLEQQAKKS